LISVPSVAAHDHRSQQTILHENPIAVAPRRSAWNKGKLVGARPPRHVWATRTKTSLALIHDAADAMRLTARGYHRVLRVARTLADLDGAETVGRTHVAEALSYRVLVDDVRRAA
jgi:hypothetical protein